MSKDGTQRTAAQWRGTIRFYQLMRELESPESMRTILAMVEHLRDDGTTLNRTALRLDLDVYVPEIKLADFSASGIRRRLAAKGYGPRHLQLTDSHLDKLTERIEMDRTQLRAQAWTLGLAAEQAMSWIEAYTDRRDELREHPGGRSPSVGLTFLVGETLDVKLSEVAKRLADAKAIPERETEYDDPIEQWSQVLKRARTRFRQRYKGQK